MHYFTKDETEVNKYSVDFDLEKLKSLRTTIINECSIIEHKTLKSVQSDRLPDSNDYFRYRNVRINKSGKKEHQGSCDYFPEFARFDCEFDEYYFPYLVSLIDRLIAGDVNVIPEIMAQDMSKEVSLLSKLATLNDEINSIDNGDYELKIQKLREYKRLKEMIALNSGRKNVSDYYPQVASLILISLVDQISIEDVNRFNQFFGVDVLGTPGINR